jgi:ABC-2 type transport system ATP-binding protein
VAVKALAGVEGVESAHASGSEVVARAVDGAATVSPVAIALASAGIKVQALTLRTPTLDDVFLELTGNRIDSEHDSGDEQEPR